MAYPFQSNHFKTPRSQPLEDAAVRDDKHILFRKPPAKLEQGEHVARLHRALAAIRAKLRNGQGIDVPAAEVNSQTYGELTAAAVLDYKRWRDIRGPGQAVPDNIVGIRTMARLDDDMLLVEKAPPAPPTPPVPPPEPPDPNILFVFGPVPQEGIVLKFGDDDRGKPDLKAGPVSTMGERVALATAETFLRGPFMPPGPDRRPPLTARMCEDALIAVVKRGGNEAEQMARRFFSNAFAGTTFTFDETHFWSQQVRAHSSFQKDHSSLTEALRLAIQSLADGPGVLPSTKARFINPALLAEGSGTQPQVLQDWVTAMDFTDFSGAIAGTALPLAYAFGSIQGLEIRLMELSGNQRTGDYQGKLTYRLFDHYGSDPFDVKERGQAGLYTLQRQGAPDQDKARNKPYRSMIITGNVAFTGKAVWRPH